MTNRTHASGLEKDWGEFLHSAVEPSCAELDLRRVQTGDRVLVRTRNTDYLLHWLSDNEVELASSNPNGPQGKVQIMGTTFGLSSSIRPDFLTCETNLELTYNDGHRTWTTSPIVEIRYIHKSKP